MTKQIFASFWDFSLAHYAQPHVADYCLQLQNHYGVNVNVLLWTLWLESRGKLLTIENLKAGLAVVGEWDANYVQSLRQLRRNMKDQFAENLAQVAHVREQIKCAELLAEKQEQQWLENLALCWPESSVEIAKCKNLHLYLMYLNIPQTIIDRAIIQCGV